MIKIFWFLLLISNAVFSQTTVYDNSTLLTARDIGSLIKTFRKPGTDTIYALKIFGTDTSREARFDISNATTTMAKVTGLVLALEGKQATIATGTNLQYLRGDLTLATFPTTTAGFSNSTNKNLLTDAQLAALGIAAAGTLTGTTLASNVTSSSITSFGASIALGTPASGNLANCTFPTLNQNTSGSAAILATQRSIYGNNFNGSAALSQIIASTFGGTGNGFTKFSGATTSEKTYTLPDATTTILTTNAAVTVPQGGTGAGTFTGIMVGNGASAMTAVAGTSGQFLRRNIANNAYEFATLAGGGDMLAANNLSDVANATTARSNLGLVIGTNVLAPNGSGASITGIPITAVTGYTGYTLAVQALTSSPTDAQTIYFGNIPRAPTSTAATSKIFIRKAGTIKVAEIYCQSGTAGTNEAWSIYVRVNNTTETLIATVSLATGERVWTNTGLSIAVVVGDYIEIKSVNPTWVTNPLTTIFGGYIYIE